MGCPWPQHPPHRVLYYDGWGCDIVLVWWIACSSFSMDRFGSKGLFNEFICTFCCFFICISYGYGLNVVFVITILCLGLIGFSIGLYDCVSIFYASTVWKFVLCLMKCVLSLSTCLGGKLGFIMGPYAHMLVLGLLHAESVYCNVTHLHAGLIAHFLHFLLLFLVIMFTGTVHTAPKHHKTVSLSSLLRSQIKPFLLPIVIKLLIKAYFSSYHNSITLSSTIVNLRSTEFS